MRSRGCWAGCALAAWFMCDVRATDYYVHAKMGADSNSGSASAPFRSLGKLETVMQSGDRAFLSGTFHEPLVLFGYLAAVTRREVRVYDVKMTVLPSVSPYGGGISAFGTF